MPGKRDASALSGVDFLAASLSPRGGVSLSRGACRVEAPWALAHFGVMVLQQGWWRFDYAGSAEAAEVRLSSALNPLVIIPAGPASGFIHLEEAEYDVRLLISPWPGTYNVSTLRLKKLDQLETAAMLGKAATRLVRRKGALGILVRAARQVLAGQALGLKTAPAPQPVETRHEPSTDHAPFAAATIAREGLTAVVGQGDVLHRQAFAIAEGELSRNPDLKAVYCDTINAGTLIPQPEWDASLAAHGVFAQAPAFFRSADASSLQEIANRYGASAIGRIPLPLVKRSSSAQPARRVDQQPGTQDLPLVSAIIPTKYRMDLLDKCLKGLAQKTGYPNLEVVIVDNGVEDASFAGLVENASRSFPVRVVEDKGVFNFSRLMNVGVAASNGEIVLSLNDDVEATDEGWLHKLVASANVPDAGVVGPQLLYPDASVQHAGVVLGLGGTCAHLWRGLDHDTASRNPYVMSPGRRMAVTGACMAIRRTAFDRVGGFDEAFPVAYNDIDFCLRLHEAGLQNFYRGDVSLIHHEGQSRGMDDATVEKRKRQSVEAARFLERWRALLDTDPSFSPAFDPTREIGVAHKANFVADSEYEAVRPAK